MKKRIKHNNLLPWFTQDHGTLPASYLASCKKFFKELSDKRQASSLTRARYNVILQYKGERNVKKRT